MYEFLKGLSFKYPGIVVMSSEQIIFIYQLSAMFTCRDGKGEKLSNQASKMLHSLRASQVELFDHSECPVLVFTSGNYTRVNYVLMLSLQSRGCRCGQY